MVIAKPCAVASHVPIVAIVSSNARHKECNWQYRLTGYSNHRNIHTSYEEHEEAEMHPYLQAQLAALHQTDLQAEAAAVHGPSRPSRYQRARNAEPSQVVIRRAVAADRPALAALSALDSAPMPLGPALVAAVGGIPRAVLPLDGGRAFGDPFERTDELVALLELRSAQMRRADDSPHEHRGRLGWLMPAIRRLV
jgi:hypothetical protein